MQSIQPTAMEIRMITMVIVVLMLSVTGFSHGGGTNADGCHNNSKTGGFHCHGAPTDTYLTRTVAPVKVVAVQADSLDGGGSEVGVDDDVGGEVGSEVIVCCKVCKKGKACGNSCIARWKSCHKSVGCACDG